MSCLEYQLAAEELLGELESSCLEVCLVPERRRTCEGGMIRVAVSKNASWYRAFCSEYTALRFRKTKRGKVPYQRKNALHDTRIKRAHTIRTLQRFAAGEAPQTVYGERLLPIIQRRAQSLELPCAL